EQRLAPERVVVVHVLVAEREAEDPLPDDLPDIVLDATAVAVVHETLREALDDAPAALDPAEQQHPGVRSDLATVEIGHEFAAAGGLGAQVARATVCGQGRSRSFGECALNNASIRRMAALLPHFW